MSTPCCDWCGKTATHTTYRTLYVNTVAEQTSRYNECDKCGLMPTAALGQNRRFAFLTAVRKRWEERLGLKTH